MRPVRAVSRDLIVFKQNIVNRAEFPRDLNPQWVLLLNGFGYQTWCYRCKRLMVHTCFGEFVGVAKAITSYYFAVV